jgi:hypothetical protein
MWLSRYAKSRGVLPPCQLPFPATDKHARLSKHCPAINHIKATNKQCDVFHMWTDVSEEHITSTSRFLSSHLLHVGFLLGWFSTLKMDVILSSETSVHIRTTLRYIIEDGNSCENLKSYFYYYYYHYYYVEILMGCLESHLDRNGVVRAIEIGIHLNSLMTLLCPKILRARYA